MRSPRRLPKDASVELAKDATAVGWVYQYALVDDSGQYSLEQMRSYQDWYLRYALQSLPGVAEVAPVGGFVREYQVNLDPIRLQAYKLPVNAVADAISKSNNDVGGRLVEFSGREYMVRGRGYLRSLDDIGNIVLLSNAQSGTPVRVRDVATLTYGPALRRGVTDLDGRGEAVGGVVIMRVGENAEKVIERVKAQLALVQPSLPKGLRVVPVYDRSELIDRAVDNLRHTLIEELIIVSLVILIFLWHFPSAAIPIITIPVTILIAFIPLQLSGMTANIMSLGGIAVAIGAMVDAAIVVVEQTHKKLEHWEADGTQGRLPAGGDRRGEGSGRPKLLRAAGDRRLVYAGVCPGGAGGPAVQAAGADQDAGDGDCGAAGHHAGPGDAPAADPREGFQLPSQDGWRVRQARCWWERFATKKSIRSASR